MLGKSLKLSPDFKLSPKLCDPPLNGNEQRSSATTLQHSLACEEHEENYWDAHDFHGKIKWPFTVLVGCAANFIHSSTFHQRCRTALFSSPTSSVQRIPTKPYSTVLAWAFLYVSSSIVVFVCPRRITTSISHDDNDNKNSNATPVYDGIASLQSSLLSSSLSNVEFLLFDRPRKGACGARLH